MATNEKSNVVIDSIKNATTELLILSILNEKDMHTYAIIETLDKLSDGFFKISFPYAAIYKLLNNNYIYEKGKKVDANRRRQFYGITPEGRKHLAETRSAFKEYEIAVDKILSLTETNNE